MRRPFLGRLSVRLLAFNLLLVFLPLASLLYLDTYEKQLLEMQEASMIQQGRVFASAMAGVDLAAESTAILARLGARVDSRIRVVDTGGRLVADSAAEPAAAKPRSAPGAEAQAASRKANERMLYRTFVSPINAVRRWLLPPGESYDSGEFYSGAATLLGPEVQAALAGRYGSITRLSTGGQVSVNLYSAIPVFGSASNEVRGAVLVSRSTYGILRRLYEVRLELIKVFVFSLAAALLLSVALSMTITVPIVRLKRQAEGVLDRSGRFRGRFTGLRRKDEIGDLSRSLSDLSARLERRIGFIDGFTADLLHELKNPLAAIRGAVELALSEPGGDDVGGDDD
ncbi:MAG TPA: histidine kinase, partial [Spirochaetales bacterium]|nr:histidine kinase [Spirochaetales bacterium]